MNSIPTPADRFEEWLHAPLGREDCEDPRFAIRRATPADYERIYDTVDRAFGRKRPRAVYDWLYRRNPFGLARCWITTLRSTGELLKTGADFPWPIWRGREPLPGVVGGDAATLPDWQRKGLSRLRRPITRSHPWYGEVCSIAGPNEGSRAVARDAERSDQLLGFLPGGIRPLHARALLERVRVPAPLARVLGGTSDALLAGWDGLALRTDADGRSGGRIEELRRFDGAFDDLTLRCMSFPMFWSPHNADFLNWRYLDHPGESYRAFALVEDERPTAYAVLRLDREGDGATLAELVAPRAPSAHARGLLRHALTLARDAGCAYLAFFGTPSWPHWPALRRAGFLPYRSPNFLEASCRSLGPEVTRMESWQLGPGDRDYH